MDGETDHAGKEEMESGTEVATAEEDSSHVTADGHETDGVPAEVAASSHEEESSESVKAAEEPPVEAATPEPADKCGDDITTAKDLGVNVDEDSDGDGPPGRLRLETPGKERTTSPARQEAKGANPGAARGGDTICEEERAGAGQRCSAPQAELAEYLRGKDRDDARPEREMPASERLQEYHKYINTLTDLKQQLATDTEEARQQAEELRLEAQGSLDKVEGEWRALVALKQHVAVTALSRCLGRRVAHAKVESTLAADQLRQDALIQLRLKHIELTMKIRRMEAELRDGEERDRDPLQLQFDQLQAARLEQKALSEKHSEESTKLQDKISRGLELLSNVKEKLFWSKAEVQAKQEQLAKLEAMVARKKGLLTRTKQACNRLKRDNLRLKECRGLLGNRVLLRDFEDTVDASDHLEEQLENLKCRQAEIGDGWGRWKEKLGTAK
ncbi:coiled-coil domain-containing protein 96 [Scophthalmus maximus]|uniref:CCDC113/CCDC96 coiled-coil domain-containing protein n=1 Tax=Scophthalmus maximus TaxID=52904 RepID=A0A6A4T1N4_SCOMX|nr:coiled-coil domain-containing protein 96 [Scophthalmus maximus]KAF0038985.1 hypothetical protein F2P81_009469 [Scophthalmus maximus]